MSTPISERKDFFEEDNIKAEKLSQKPEISYILLCCCTCKRPLMLTETLKSVNSLKLPENIKVEMLVVDNDKEQSAKRVVEEAKSNFKIKLYYIQEPQRGIAYARNRVLEEAIKLNASHIQFFDDDEVLNENCLLEHIKLYQTNPDAYISSGPTLSIFMGDFPNYIKNHLVFKQKYSKETGAQKEDCACGNVFFPLAVAKDFNLRFSTEYTFMGGEDGDFFYRASLSGFTIIWNQDAIIEEMVSVERANLKYIFKKCYYNGYAGALQSIKRFNINQKNYKRLTYILKQIPVLFINLLILIPSLILGLSTFFNILGICIRTKGKIDACIKNKAINFYNKIYGS